MATDIAIDLPATAEPETRSRTRRLPFIIGAILVIALGTWGVRRYLYGRNHVSTDNAQVDGHITAISPRISGFIDRVLVEENQHVKAGRHAGGARSARPRRAAGTGRGGSAHRAGGGGLQAQWRRGCGPIAGHAGAGRVRPGGHHRGGSDLSPSQRRSTSATAGWRRLRSSRPNSSTRRRPRKTRRPPTSRPPAVGPPLRGARSPRRARRLRGADARLAAAQSAVETARLQLGYATLLAPSSGIVAKRNAEPGALVQIGQNLMSIVPDTNVWVTANMKETQLAKIRVGDPAEFTVDAYPGRDLPRQGREPEPGHRRALRPAAARQRDRQLHQGRPARCRSGSRWTARPTRRTRCGPGMSVDVDHHDRLTRVAWPPWRSRPARRR